MPVKHTRKDGTEFLTHRFTFSQLSGEGRLSYVQKLGVASHPEQDHPFDEDGAVRVKKYTFNNTPFEEIWTQEVI